MNYRLIWVALATILAMASCKDSAEDNQLPYQGGEYNGSRNSTLASITRSESYTPEDFTKEVMPGKAFENILSVRGFNLGALVDPLLSRKAKKLTQRLDTLFQREVGTDKNGQRRWQVESYVFNYTTLASTGERVQLSGRVTFPNNTVSGTAHEVQTLSLCSHMAVWDSTNVPTNKLGITPMRALHNSAVIEPDFQGFGVDEGKHIYGCCLAEPLQRQMTDCALAALEVMRKHDVRLADDGYSTCWGASLGILAPLAFSKYYETQAPASVRKAIRLRSTFAGGGPTDSWDYLALYQDDFYVLPAQYYFTIVALASLPPNQLKGYKASDFLADRYMTDSIMCKGKNMLYYDFVHYTTGSYYSRSMLGKINVTSLDSLLPADMLTADGKSLDMNSPKTKALKQILEEQGNLYGYSPSLPLYLAHCKYDECQPYDIARKFYNKISAHHTNPNVHWADIPYPKVLASLTKNIHMPANHLLSSLFLTMDMAVAEDPEDMYKQWED